MTDCSKPSFFSWKLLFYTIFLVCVFFGFFSSGRRHKIKHDSIAKITIDGVISDDTTVVEKLDSLRKNDKIRALIVVINSPGGGVVPSFKIYESIKKFSDNKKPIVVVMESVAASGGYLIALAADYIIAHATTITGSIGVIFMQPDFKELMNKIGIKPLTFKTGKLKASPAPGEEVTPETKKMMNEMLDGTKAEFLNLVLKRRNITDEKIIEDISNSGIYLGLHAKKIGLVDDCGGIDQAVEWLKTQNIDLPIENINMKEDSSNSIIKKLLREKVKANLEDFMPQIVQHFDKTVSRSGLYLLFNE